MKVLITGGTGFLGKHLQGACKLYGHTFYAVGSKNYDLTLYDDAYKLVKDYKPDAIIHAAGHNGGIEYNRLFPAEILDKNLCMASNVYNAALHHKVDKIVAIATSCAYPDLGEEILSENRFWDGECNPSIKCHGVAKRMLQAYSEMYNKQYGMNCVTAAVTNLYGPGDTFNLTRTKVVAAVIRKIVEAEQQQLPYVEFWGTGKPKRQFMFVKDAAKAIVQLLMYKCDPREPINIGSDDEFTIKELVTLVSGIVGYAGEIRWLTEKGDGQMRKFMSVDKMNKYLAVKQTTLMDGLMETVSWYINNKEEADKCK